LSEAKPDFSDERAMKVLLVKLSSLGDVVHSLPAATDIHRAFPNAQIDWVVESGFAPLVERCTAVHRVIPCQLREWRKTPFSLKTRKAWHHFLQTLQAEQYDAIIDLQGLTKSAWVSWLARLSEMGQRFAMANRTEGSGYEAPTRWVADVALRIEPHIHAVARGRVLCAAALNYEVPSALDYGLGRSASAMSDQVVLVHGTSRADKEWPVSHWIELGQRLNHAGLQVVLPHGNTEEQQRAQTIASALLQATVWPRYAIDELTTHMATCRGVIGVDSGLSHIAVALDLPHVQIYNFDTGWRTGPTGVAHQCSVVDVNVPNLNEVWSAWQRCLQRFDSTDAKVML
jgi:heptosyltransferase-1